MAGGLQGVAAAGRRSVESDACLQCFGSVDSASHQKTVKPNCCSANPCNRFGSATSQMTWRGACAFDLYQQGPPISHPDDSMVRRSLGMAPAHREQSDIVLWDSSDSIFLPTLAHRERWVHLMGPIFQPTESCSSQIDL